MQTLGGLVEEKGSRGKRRRVALMQGKDRVKTLSVQNSRQEQKKEETLETFFIKISFSPEEKAGKKIGVERRGGAGVKKI